MKTLRDLTIRLMFNRDLSKVLEIERRKPGPAWTRNDFRPVFRAPDADGWVAEIDGEVVGFVVFRHVADESGRRVVLRNFGVAPYWRRRGVGRAMFRKIEDRLRSAEDRVQVTVPESNLPAQLFLRGVGYKAVRVLRDHFGGEDGFFMERRKAGATTPLFV